MDSSPKRQCRARPREDQPREIGLWLWVLEDCRARTLRAIQDLGPDSIDLRSHPARNSIGSLLYHIAAIEMDWLFTEILEQEIPDEIMALFPHEVRDAEGRLTHVPGLTLADHRARLAQTRAVLEARVGTLDVEELQRVRRLDAYDVDAEWVLHHLAQHEAEHRGQILDIRARVGVGGK
jgi:uncharacterized damage-inducible protein DinB